MDQKIDFKCDGFLRAISSYTLMLLRDERGSRFLQTCILTQTGEENEFLYALITRNCADIAIHGNSFSILQHCIAHGTDLQKVRLVRELTRHVMRLAQHPFGNYVINYLLDQHDTRFKEDVVRALGGSVCALSTQKFSSLVVEKSICVAGHESRRLLIDEIIESLDSLLKDPYGNYCVQTALDYAEPSQKATLVERIRLTLPNVCSNRFFRRIKMKLYHELSSPPSSRPIAPPNPSFRTTNFATGTHGTPKLYSPYPGVVFPI
ncbi:ARM repeat-containing protein [Ramaria rubella]|nr:ARM repeat-containing protein [Ramaria rubella]